MVGERQEVEVVKGRGELKGMEEEGKKKDTDVFIEMGWKQRRVTRKGNEGMRGPCSRKDAELSKRARSQSRFPRHPLSQRLPFQAECLSAALCTRTIFSTLPTRLDPVTIGVHTTPLFTTRLSITALGQRGADKGTGV
ncbi:unnamed protein product [Pleuronectes platessa]|uniref:Uncharacterized protein n=1 Tax=Pleuronectes platessa TaxID=8262 RepID=A0A9N7TYN7_PLEPL|nr:unnamed protein product [Pleuronectes platessa]